MWELEREIYEKLAEKVIEALCGESYFAGTIELEHNGVEVSLLTTLLIYRRNAKSISAESDDILQVIPVWWECEVRRFGSEHDELFDFGEFVRAIIEYQ